MYNPNGQESKAIKEFILFKHTKCWLVNCKIHQKTKHR